MAKIQYATPPPLFFLAFAGGAIVLLFAWNSKWRPVAILLVIAILVGWVLRFEPAVVSQLKTAIKGGG